jgi:hypothetical protein
MIPIHHAGKYLPKTKSFIPHDFTLIASVVGESVIGHGTGRKVSQLKWCNLLVAGGSDNDLLSPDLIATQQVRALKSKYVDAMYYTEFLM